MTQTEQIIKIDKYEFKSVRQPDGKQTTVFYAVKGKDKYPMPSAFQEMYTEQYLAIRKVEPLEMSEVLGEDLSQDYYIPLFTGAVE